MNGTTFKKPLVVNTKDRPFKSGVYNFKAVREEYERLGGNPFGIKPEQYPNPEPEVIPG